MCKYVLSISGSIACLSLAYAAFCGALALQQLSRTAILVQGDLAVSLAQANGQITGLRGDLQGEVKNLTGVVDKQLTQANSTLETGTAVLLTQTDSIQKDVTLAASGLYATNKAIETVISDPNIPKLVRDLRQTAALGGVTMAHVEGMSNTIDKAMPAFVASSASIANSTAGIAKDAHKVTDQWTAPKTFWQKVKLVFEGAAEIAVKVY